MAGMTSRPRRPTTPLRHPGGGGGVSWPGEREEEGGGVSGDVLLANPPQMRAMGSLRPTLTKSYPQSPDPLVPGGVSEQRRLGITSPFRSTTTRMDAPPHSDAPSCTTYAVEDGARGFS